jgi:hypothetical protein
VRLGMLGTEEQACTSGPAARFLSTARDAHRINNQQAVNATTPLCSTLTLLLNVTPSGLGGSPERSAVSHQRAPPSPSSLGRCCYRTARLSANRLPRASASNRIISRRCVLLLPPGAMPVLLTASQPYFCVGVCVGVSGCVFLGRGISACVRPAASRWQPARRWAYIPTEPQGYQWRAGWPGREVWRWGARRSGGGAGGGGGGRHTTALPTGVSLTYYFSARSPEIHPQGCI